MATLSGLSTVESELLFEIGDLGEVSAPLVTGVSTFIITQTVRGLTNGVAPVGSPISGDIDSSVPPWVTRPSGVNSLILSTVEGLAPIDSKIETVIHLEGSFTIFGLLRESGEGSGGTVPVPEPLSPDVKIPSGGQGEAVAVYNVFLDGEDVTNRVDSLKITFSREKFCGEVDVSWKDDTIFSRVNCLPIDRNLRLRITKRTMTKHFNSDGTYAQSFGAMEFDARFFIEKRDTSLAFGARSVSSWGRSLSALLTTPFAKKYTENLDVLTDALETGVAVKVTAIVEEIMESVGLVASDCEWTVLDYKIRAGKFSVVDMYPIEALQRLAEVVGAVVFPNRLYHVTGSPLIYVSYKYPV